MRRLVLALAVVLAVTGFAGTASGGVKRHYSHAYFAAGQRCGDRTAGGRNVRQHGSTLSNGERVTRAKYRVLTSKLNGMCRPLPRPVVQTVPGVLVTPAAPSSAVPSGPSTGRSSGGFCGAYQFDDATWQSVGGSGSACGASPAEQDARAQALLDQRGTSPWPNCGSTNLAAIRQCENSGRY